MPSGNNYQVTIIMFFNKFVLFFRSKHTCKPNLHNQLLLAINISMTTLSRHLRTFTASLVSKDYGEESPGRFHAWWLGRLHNFQPSPTRRIHLQRWSSSPRIAGWLPWWRVWSVVWQWSSAWHRLMLWVPGYITKAQIVMDGGCFITASGIVYPRYFAVKDSWGFIRGLGHTISE